MRATTKSSATKRIEETKKQAANEIDLLIQSDCIDHRRQMKMMAGPQNHARKRTRRRTTRQVNDDQTATTTTTIHMAQPKQRQIRTILERSIGLSRCKSHKATTTATTRKQYFSTIFSPTRMIMIIIAITCSASLQLPPLVSSSAVVRPTIFKEDQPTPLVNNINANNNPPPLPVSQVTSQQQQQQQLQHQDKEPKSLPQNGMTTTNTQFSHPLPSAADNGNHNGNHNHHQQQHQQQQHSTKINPMKSKFCTNSLGQRADGPLGLESYAIDDLSLSASSFSNEQVRPHLARLNLDLLGGAWCPMKPISSSNYGKEWIQVKLNRSQVITGVETQGRFASGSGKEFAPNYSIEYSRDGGHTWHKWKDFRGSWLLRANDDTNTPTRNELSPPIVGANVIRLVPYSQHLRTVCLRLELHGCQYDEGAPIAYSSQDGVVEPRWGHLIDYTYDGQRRAGQLSAGLGQLVDGVKGADNFSFNNGFEWVGWKSMNGDVVIEFAFKTVRNFTGALFHSNNLFSAGVEVFQAVDVQYGLDVGASMEALRDSLLEQRRRDPQPASQFQSASPSPSPRQQQLANQDQMLEYLAGVSGQQQQQTLWSPDVLSIEYEPDKKLEASRPVTVHLKQRLANRLRFTLKFASKWILVSEVEFLSHPVELLSLADLQDQLSLPLMVALVPAKTYDEYVAILREHQLRRIAKDLFFGAQANLEQSSSSSAVGALQEDQPGETSTAASGGTVVDNDADNNSNNNNSNNDDADQPGSSVAVRQQPEGPDLQALLQAGGAKRAPVPSVLAPSQWPGLNQLNSNLNLGPGLGLGLGSQVAQQADSLATQQNSIFASQAVNQPPSDQGNGNGNSNRLDGAAGSRRALGLATVVSFALVAVLLAVGLLFALSSYRLRHQAKPVAGLHHHHHHQHQGGPSSWCQTASSASKSYLMNNVLVPSGSSAAAAASAASGSSRTAVQTSSSAVGPLGHQLIVGQQQSQLLLASSGSSSADSHYNPLFAASGQSSDGSLKTTTRYGGPLSTLKKLANLTSSTTTRSKLVRHHNESPLFQHQQQQHQNQLLVSLKDSFGGASGGSPANGKGQSISTQLIVGLNQANPMAQHQIYNSSNGNNNNNNYSAAHYSTSMSMASGTSSQQANGPDYSGLDYAIPELQAGNFGPTPAINRFTGGQQSTAGELLARSSARMIQPFVMQHQQHQQQQQPQPRIIEHNYEHILYGEHQQQQQPATSSSSRPPTSHQVQLHNRTLSNQNASQQQAPSSFNSMTLATNQQRLRQQQQQQAANNRQLLDQQADQLQPNGATNGASHYYYSSAATEATK